MGLTAGDDMSQGISYIDIIFLALVAGFLILRLRSVLGRRTGNEKPPMQRPQDEDVVVDLATRRRADQDDAARPARSSTDELPLFLRRSTEPLVAPEAMGGVMAIKAADPAFDENRFLAGSVAAFEMILNAYVQGDTKMLRSLLADEVYRQFAEAIKGFADRGEKLETELIGMRAASITSARLDGRNAFLTVRFVTEQMIVVRDRSGAILEGDPSRFEQLVDAWTFSRDIASRDPNWRLVTTTTPEE
ncbi:Tim44/TimA family putative adaptor protein [Insolitispirillum peregrinum]|uniref:Predicted lipid-binding transport protein, Tim44 family n=2 Tax=Insolitispirillum peregrinum TaxID=80876 RepID=A0A1N7JEA9_9PROT|nr:Predicted lipid-binding transport protein, Tim44 family [Insolitispirillum peregrinum]